MPRHVSRLASTIRHWLLGDIQAMFKNPEMRAYQNVYKMIKQQWLGSFPSQAHIVLMYLMLTLLMLIRASGPPNVVGTLLLSVTLAFPLVVIGIGARESLLRRAFVKVGRYRESGYDLQASPVRCPKCGNSGSNGGIVDRDEILTISSSNPAKP